MRTQNLFLWRRLNPPERAVRVIASTVALLIAEGIIWKAIPAALVVPSGEPPNGAAAALLDWWVREVFPQAERVGLLMTAVIAALFLYAFGMIIPAEREGDLKFTALPVSSGKRRWVLPTGILLPLATACLGPWWLKVILMLTTAIAVNLGAAVLWVVPWRFEIDGQKSYPPE